MIFWFYKILGSCDVRVSISLEVDLYYWQGRGLLLDILGNGKQPILHQNLSLKFRSSNLYKLDEGRWHQLDKLAQYFLKFASGRALTWSELLSLAERARLQVSEHSLRAAVQLLVLQDKAILVPAVSEAKCNRCSAERSSLIDIICDWCKSSCKMCERCVMMGRVTSCRALFLFKAEPSEKQPVILKLQLTRPQQAASKRIQEKLTLTQKVLVWAVTGSGKTELIMPIVAEYLQAGKKVAWVTPRKDVVLELLPRVKELLPGVAVIALYGGSTDLWIAGNLILSTVHQAWRYNASFELIIIDEVDAFPLYGDHTMQASIDKAGRPDHRQIFLTATPPKELRKLESVILPVRYHGKPLPVPSCFLDGQLSKKLHNLKPIKYLQHFLDQVLVSRGQALIFVPRIADISDVLSWLKCFFGWDEALFAGVNAQDPDREKKVLALREERLRLLVTTTILERGVTLPRCHVLVLYADHALFDTASLIQIAGRVGRSKNYQDGQVVFLAQENTLAQQKACQEIKSLNKTAHKAGFL